jgi:hypothetical protein
LCLQPPRTLCRYGLHLLVLVHEAPHHFIHDGREHECNVIPEPQGVHLYRNERDGAIEEADHVQEASGDLFSDDDRAVLVLGVPLALNVPVLYCANDVGFVRRPELDLYLVATERIRVLEQKIETACARPRTLPVLQDDIAQSKNRRIFSNAILHPSLVQLRVLVQ